MSQLLLREPSICHDLVAKDNLDALKQMVKYLPSEGITSYKRQKIYQEVLEREQFGTTAIGGGIALPRCIFNGIKEPLASLGVSRDGIVFPSLDGEPVHVVMMIVFPENKFLRKQMHDTMGFVGELFRDAFLIQRLRISKSSEEAYEILMRETALRESTGILVS